MAIAAHIVGNRPDRMEPRKVSAVANTTNTYASHATNTNCELPNSCESSNAIPLMFPFFCLFPAQRMMYQAMAVPADTIVSHRR